MSEGASSQGNKGAQGPADLVRAVLLGQGAYYLVTGIWPLLDIGSFQKVTGPKVDTWLVKMVGALISVVGLVLAMAGRRGQKSAEMPVLGVGSALAFTAIDVFYVARKRISPVYLLDAISELGIVAAWIIALASGRGNDVSPGEGEAFRRA